MQLGPCPLLNDNEVSDQSTFDLSSRALFQQLDERAFGSLTDWTEWGFPYKH
jgi:hypothetical protein